ncbi:hypothetical protein HDV05_004769 [Chytridiales sp. JEL 0842]|nr:hypothetical protein HDV05_004769 [Chytridiales sp. JEL 0842]
MNNPFESDDSPDLHWPPKTNPKQGRLNRKPYSPTRRYPQTNERLPSFGQTFGASGNVPVVQNMQRQHPQARQQHPLPPAAAAMSTKGNREFDVYSVNAYDYDPAAHKMDVNALCNQGEDSQVVPNAVNAGKTYNYNGSRDTKQLRIGKNGRLEHPSSRMILKDNKPASGTGVAPGAGSKKPRGLDALRPSQILKPASVTDLIRSPIVNAMLSAKPGTLKSSPMMEAGYHAIELKANIYMSVPRTSHSNMREFLLSDLPSTNGNPCSYPLTQVSKAPQSNLLLRCQYWEMDELIMTPLETLKQASSSTNASQKSAPAYRLVGMIRRDDCNPSDVGGYQAAVDALNYVEFLDAVVPNAEGDSNNKKRSADDGGGEELPRKKRTRTDVSGTVYLNGATATLEDEGDVAMTPDSWDIVTPSDPTPFDENKLQERVVHSVMKGLVFQCFKVPEKVVFF